MDATAPQSADVCLRCIGCGGVATGVQGDCRCPSCHDLLEVELDAQALAGRSPAEWKALWRQRRASEQPCDRSGVWRFRELLPILRVPTAAVTLREGNTPIYELPTCARDAGLQHLWAKHQGLNPTGSFKDTGMTAAVSRAREEGFEWLACASTGNTSASMAAYAARAGMKCLVLVPEGKIAWGKLAQALDFGALTCQLRTDFDGCVRVLSEVIRRKPVYLVNSVNPYRLEGQKTVAVELLEAMEWRVPDHVVVPGGNLANASALGKGLMELLALGLIPRLPKLSIVQAEGANPLVRSVRDFQGRALVPVIAETLASAIRIGNPASWKKAVRVLEQTDGACLDVSESEIAMAKDAIGAEGVGCEPASAAALAGARKLAQQGFIAPHEMVVLVLTGHGLKDTDYTLALHRGSLLPGTSPTPPPRPPAVLEPNAAEVLRTMERE
ncbi:MAG TPA: threonine synthase [Terriglobales bacterium]|nr:threonine synthase [Terriglobales bacterium]